MAYTSFLNGLKSGQFKSSLAEQKETTLVEALRKVADFIGTTEICTESSDAPKKIKGPIDRNVGCRDRRPKLETIDPRFTTYLRSILMEVKEHPMLKRPSSMTSALKPHSMRKYCELHEQHGHTTAGCRELRKALHDLANKGQIDFFLKRGPHFLQKEREPAQPDPETRVLYRTSSHHCRRICRGYHSVHLEASALRRPVGSDGRAREPSYNTQDGVRGWRRHALYLPAK